MLVKSISKYVALGALFILPIFPLIVADSFFFPFITGKAFYFRVLVEVAFAAWVILAFLDARYRPRFTGLTVGVTLFAVIALIADLLGVNPMRSLLSNFERMEGWLTIIHLWAFYIVATSLFHHTDEGKRNWHNWFNASLLVALIVGIHGIGQLLGWWPIHQGSTRIDASLGNSAYMAIYMLMHAFIAAYMTAVAWARKIYFASVLKWVYLVLSVLFGFLVFMTLTRGTMLGLMAGALFALFLYAINPKGVRKARYISAGIIGLFIILGIAFIMTKDTAFVQSNQVLSRLSTISWSESTNQARQQIWPMAIKGAMERPIFGWGQENFNYIFNANYNPVMYAQEQWFDRAHSVFLDWLVAGGILGLIAYLALYVLFLRGVWKSDLGVSQKSILTGFITAYFVHNIFVFDNLASYVMFFAVLGFVDSLRESKHMKVFGHSPVRSEVVEYVVAPVTIIVLVAVIFFLNVRPIQANTRLIGALTKCGSDPDIVSFERALKIGSTMSKQETREQLMNCALRVVSDQKTTPQKTKEFFDFTSKEIKNQIDDSPSDARVYALGGSFFNSLGQYEQSIPILEKAHELSPAKQTIAFELATAYINVRKNNEALELMKKAYESEPSFYQAKLAYVTTLILAGKEADAKKEFANEEGLFLNEQIANIYIGKGETEKGIAIYRQMIKNNPKDPALRGRLAEIQLALKQPNAAIETLRGIQNDFPELKDQIDEAIKQIK